MLIFLLIIVISLVFIYALMNLCGRKNAILWHSPTKPAFFPNSMIHTFKKSNFKYVEYDEDWILYIPRDYDDPNLEYANVTVKDDALYFVIDNVDIMVAKDWLYKICREVYGDVSDIFPASYLVDTSENIMLFEENYSKNKLYIIKKNVQRQQGIVITNSLTEIKNRINEKNDTFNYVIIQELLQDPYLINHRKINLRIYVLVICKGDDFAIHMYNDGFLYYTSEKFKYGSSDLKSNITTGYIDREVYTDNPLTLKDLYKYLDSDRSNTEHEKELLDNGNVLSEYLHKNITNLINKVFSAFNKRIGYNKRLYNNLKFQLFGADVAVSEKLECKIMEINKGPDLTGKDDRDLTLKKNLVRDIFSVVELTNQKNLGFIQL